MGKPLVFMGSSLDDLRDFPAAARRAVGFELGAVLPGEPESLGLGLTSEEHAALAALGSDL